MEAIREHIESQRTPTWILYFAGLALVLASAIGSSTLSHSTVEHWQIGLVMGLIFGSLLGIVVAVPLCTLVFLMVRAYVNKSEFTSKRRIMLLLLPALVTSVLLLLPGIKSLSSRSRFKQQVMNPVPPSVRVLRVEGFSAFLAHRWLLVFDISPADFDLLIKTRALEKVPPYDYLAAITNYTSRKVEPFAVPNFYGWSTSNQIPGRWRNAVANSNHTRVYFMTGFQN